MAVCCCQNGNAEARAPFMLVSVPLCRSTATWAGSADVLSCHAGHVSTTIYHSCYICAGVSKSCPTGFRTAADGSAGQELCLTWCYTSLMLCTASERAVRAVVHVSGGQYVLVENLQAEQGALLEAS